MSLLSDHHQSTESKGMGMEQAGIEEGFNIVVTTNAGRGWGVNFHCHRSLSPALVVSGSEC